MTDQQDRLAPPTSEGETIGIIGSPSSTAQITIDIVEKASGENLLGTLVYSTVRMRDHKYLLALGTIGEIETRNRWHEDLNMRGVLRVHGTLPHLSAEGDVRSAEVSIQAVYETDSSEPPFTTAPIESGGALGMSPTTGSPVKQVRDSLVQALIAPNREDVVYLGYIHGNDVHLPMYVREFTDPRSDGAIHTGVFGRTGSGKTAFACHLVAMQLRHRSMGVLVFDPQG
ncbi:hypothetical protein ASE16_01995 [Leifsonia sp. Root227]|uniref:helicase HerA domain-containing protein n=1 Tax=Leifsonia sp. Root227 TaxID=1736496 RepID=UPI0006FEBDBC|nr:DUF87 domain-containing protein [Leifsonia sp. Root227]KRC51864.1 hypothetical protein ASE16_01995 [Leifsonia sp. Root227]